MTTSEKNVERASGHRLRWVIEDSDDGVAEYDFEHPKDCPVEVDESHDADGKLAWRGEWHECAITHLEDFLIEDYFLEYMLKYAPGEHTIQFKYTYRYYPPSYPDYEPDYDFEWEKE